MGYTYIFLKETSVIAEKIIFSPSAFFIASALNTELFMKLNSM